MRPVNNISGGQVGRSRLLDLLLRDGRQRLNNGTVAGGLAHVLQQGMRGYQIGQEREAQQKAATDQTAALNAMNRGMSAQQWQPPAGDVIYDGPNGAPMSREDAAARAAPAGGYAGAITALQGLGGDNAAAGRLTSQLLMNKMERDQTIADRDEQRAYDEKLLGEKRDWERQMFDLEQKAATGRITAQEQSQLRILREKAAIDQANAPAPMPFDGNSMEAQYTNILLTGDPSSPEYAAAYNAVSAPKVTFDPSTGQQISVIPNMSAYRPPAGTAVPGQNPPAQNVGQTPPQSSQGGVSISQVAEPTKPMTEGQSNAATYADRMMEADRIIAELGDIGTSFSDKLASEVPMIGNYMVSPEYQRLLQAQRNFVNAVLRKESGAVISDQEFANAAQQYFPQPGDSQEVIRQKAENRTLAIQGIARAAGPTYKPNDLQAETSRPQPQAPKSEAEAASVPVGTIVTSAKGIQYQKVGNTGTPADWKKIEGEHTPTDLSGASGVR